MARVISKTQVSDPGPSWPSCLIIFYLLSEKIKEEKVHSRDSSVGHHTGDCINHMAGIPVMEHLRKAI